MIATRWSAAALALLLAALVPTIVHDYIGWRVDPGPSAASIAPALGDFSEVPIEESAPWVSSNFATKDWIQRQYAASGPLVTLLVVRSFDAARLYHHPEKAIPYARFLESAGSAILPTRSVGLAHLLRGESGATAAYALLYDDEFVDSPAWFQLRTAARTLIAPRHPMTLVFAHDPTRERAGAVPQEWRAVRLLDAALANYRRPR